MFYNEYFRTLLAIIASTENVNSRGNKNTDKNIFENYKIKHIEKPLSKKQRKKLNIRSNK